MRGDGAYTWSNRSFKEKVGLSGGGGGKDIQGGLIGGETQYDICLVTFQY